MPLSDRFESAVRQAFDPHTPWSGTENVGPWLYWLARIERASTVVEFGSGLTTAYLAQAVQDNRRDLAEHRAALTRLAARRRGELATLLEREIWEQIEPDVEELSELVDAALGAREEGVELPGMPELRYYELERVPHLDCFEAQSESAEYVQRLRRLLELLGLADDVTLHAGAEIAGYLAALPPGRLPVDLAWNDFGNKLQFFEETYPALDPAGGLFATHSPVDLSDEIAAIRSRLASELASGRCETLTLREPHKSMQNGCFLIRKSLAGEPPRSHRSAMRELVEGLLELAPPE